MTLRANAGLWSGVVAELLCVVLMSRHGDFLQPGESVRFTVPAVAAGAAFWLAVHGLRRSKASAQTRAGWFWIVAVLLRLAMLPTFPGDDLWRYRWEGSMQLHGFNPYALAPDSPALAAWRDADWARISHRDVPAIYPPLAEGLFAAMARGGNSVFAYKGLFAVADLGVCAVLRRMLMSKEASPEEAAWYAWNPLAVYVSAGAAHFDSLMVLAMMAAVWCWSRLTAPSIQAGTTSTWRVPAVGWMGAGLLGIATALKAVPVVLLPVWGCAVGWRRASVTLPLAVGVAPAVALCYGFPGVPVFGTLARFSQGFRVNDALRWIVDPAGRWEETFGVVSAMAVCAVVIWLRHDWPRGALWTLGAALLLAPALHAWYVLWVLPLAGWRGGSARAWVVLSISVFGYFLLWEVNRASGLPWQEPLWLRGMIYLPPLVALGCWLAVRPSGHADER